MSQAARVADPTRNRSTQLQGPRGRFRVVESDIPAPGPGEVLLRISHCGLCGTELHILDHPETFSADWSDDPDDPLTQGIQVHGFLGHEYSAVVESVGPDVVGWSAGDRVVGRARQACGRCERCMAADPINCTDQWRPFLRAYARYMPVRASQLHRIPPQVDLRVAALATPLSECLHALGAADWTAGQSALVAGAGPMGICTIALLAHTGAAPLIVSEPNAERRELAASYGAIAVPPEEALDAVRDATNGNGVDVAFECAGAIPAFGDALASLRQGGRLVIVGLASADATFELKPRELWDRRIEIAIGGAPETTLDLALRLLPQIDPERLITEVYPLDRMNEAFESFRNGRPGKLLVAPWEEAGSESAVQPVTTREES